ncbi:Smr/MutS family protein [Eudoraea sp.]|uniref:Smr/MutS family protein n=1 Tax=Eudoraea sp. TaxID=1979955 RepID=UPI003C7617C5
MRLLKIGDEVEVLDERLRGRIKNINQSQVLVHTSDGFDIFYKAEELVLINENRALNISKEEVKKALKEKELSRKKSAIRIKPKERNAPAMVIDLHIEKLVKKTSGLSNYEILNIQLDVAKRQLEFAIFKKIPKLVFIHGVGEGVLKEELYYLLRRYDQINYYDADYKQYGLGATEIYITQKK